MFKVAILQKRAINAQIDKNIRSIITAMKEASENNADILLLPECFITGYDLPMTYEKSIADDDERIAMICDVAKKYQIGVVLTAFTKGKMYPQNSAFVIDKSGRILMKYSKVHTCDFADERTVESGKDFKVCDFDGIQLGIMICYDREYPESARILMLKGAEVILVPNDCGSMQPRIQALSTRAYENMVAVAMANPNGENAGCSCAYSPICWDRNGKCVDNTVLLADDKTEGIFYAEFDMEVIWEYRSREMLGNTFRKPDAYGELLQKEIKEPFIRDAQNKWHNSEAEKYISVIGRTVTVIVDRPLGSYHPKHKDIYYPINYGYIEEIIAPDGEEQDVYILGVDKPVDRFTGRIIAVVHRNDDVEEKWVAAPENMTFSKEEIVKQIEFQEQYFDSQVVM
mgnify:FL=1